MNSRPTTWLEHLGMSQVEATRILCVARRADDDRLVRRAVIARVTRGVAIVERWGLGDERMADYPVRVQP